VLGWTLIALITLLTFIHGVAQRETYWDSLILYMGYARMMVEEGGVIRRVVGQVGIGLGANYPHLFEFFAAQTAALVGRWDDQHAQWMAPVAGLAATLLIYGTVVRASGGNRCAGVAAALCFRAYPSSLIYTQYATPYALGILAVAALLFLATVHHHHRDRASLIGMLTVSAIACHINFLMIVLFPVAIIAILFTPSAEDAAGQIRPLVRLQQLALPLIACLILASPWFIRNWIVTGNPVYAFFPGIFGGIHINPDVMESAVAEWRANGDGLHVLGPTLADKIRGLPAYFVTGSQAWKTAPVLVAWSLPGFILSLIMLVVGVLALARRRTAETGWPLPVLFLLSSLFTGLWAYAFVVADYYLYQIVPVSAVIGVLAGYLWTWLGQAGRGVRTILSVVALGTGLVPGTSMGLMGFKLKTSSQQVPSPQIQVVAARNLFLPPERIYRLEYGADMDAFAWLNRLPRNSVVLTHENRHLLHRPDLHIVHLDDWEPQQVYGQDPDTRQRALDQLGIRWYLYVPNEDRHRVNARLGMAELIRLGYWEEVQRSRASRASFPDSPANAPDSPIAADHNVLFRRTELQPAKPPAP
jgi:4-amino-4-deoxy-L-arabinose transferase-like glycosyltransferase